jgi:hypothetical protein
LLATAALGILAPDVVSARGGGGFHGGGSFHGGFHGGGAFHGGFGGAGFHRSGGFGRGGFHADGFNGGRFHGAAMAGHRFRVGQIAGTSRSAKGMTGRRTRPEVVHCLTSDCSLWHSYRD